MTPIILVILFLLQIVSFYLIALMFAKLNKFKDMEKKQEQVLKEIDDSFGAYIAEMKDENNRLIKELNKSEKSFIASTQEEIKEETRSFELPKSFVSKQLAASSYLKTVATTEKKIPVTIKEKVLFYSGEGKDIDEIAKLLQIGKTEVELFLKFKDKNS
jgi:biopolymer transport protein ExbB/TolQ